MFHKVFIFALLLFFWESSSFTSVRATLEQYITMCLKGLDTVRYRGRYYCYYNDRLDSYEGLEQIVHSEIPADLVAYRTWLEKERSEYQKLHERLEDYLSVRHYNVGEKPRVNGRSAVRPQLDHSDNNLLLPSYLPERFNGHGPPWDCIADLDREVFTVNNSAHMRLYRIPKHGWTTALIGTARGDHIIPYGVFPIGCITDIMLRTEPVSAETLKVYEDLAAKIVKPKHIDNIALSRHQGPLLSACIFGMFRQTQEDDLENLLLGWDVHDLCFRELVHAILCIAALGKNLSFVSCHTILNSREAGYSDLLSDDRLDAVSMHAGNSDDSLSDILSDTGQSTTRENHDSSKDPAAKKAKISSEVSDAEFVAHFGVGCHIQGNPAGSSAGETIYWFEGVLVVLAVQLNLPGAVASNVARVFHYHQQTCGLKPINAIVISIEHLIFLTISSCGKVEHTKPLPLFVLRTHRSKGLSSRYPAAYLEALEKHVRHKLARDLLTVRQAAEETAAMVKLADDIEARPHSEVDLDQTLELAPEDIKMIPQDMLDIHAREILEEQARDPGSLDDLTARFRQELDESNQLNANDVSVEKTFLSLILFLEVGARQGMKRGKGCFPAEVYQIIIGHLPDVETFRACMDASTVLRDLCHQELRVTADLSILPHGISSDDPSPNSGRARYKTHLFKTLHRPTGVVQNMELCPAPAWKRNRSLDDDFEVVVGKERDRRSLLLNMRSWFKPVETRNSLEIKAVPDSTDPGPSNVESR